MVTSMIPFNVLLNSIHIRRHNWQLLRNGPSRGQLEWNMSTTKGKRPVSDHSNTNLNFQQWNGCASARFASTFPSSIMYPSPWTNSDEEDENHSHGSRDEVEQGEESSEEETRSGTYLYF